MKKYFLKTTLVLGLGILLGSCGKLPQAEIDAANNAIEVAKSAGADMYVPEAYTAVVDSMNSVMANIEAQKSKWFKSYKGSVEKLTEVANMATTVKDQAELRKTEIKAEIESLISEVQALTEENKKLLTEAPRGKEGKAALDAMKSEISVIESAVTESMALSQKGDLLAAQSKIKAAKDQSSSLNTELKDVIAKYKKH